MRFLTPRRGGRVVRVGQCFEGGGGYFGTEALPIVGALSLRFHIGELGSWMKMSTSGVDVSVPTGGIATLPFALKCKVPTYVATPRHR
jgi:hypothetical protein